MSDRSTWGSRLGFVLASAGAAVGLGAICKFPYLVGSNGGSAFLFPFIVLTFTIGLVLLIAELTVGRAGAGCIVTAFRKLGGKNWGRAGYLGVITGFLILSFYSAIGGWTIAYFVNACWLPDALLSNRNWGLTLLQYQLLRDWPSAIRHSF